MELTDFNPIAGLAALWTRDQLTPENLDWLRNLPQGPVHMEDLPESQFVHGSPIDEDDYVVTARDALEPLLAFSVPLTFLDRKSTRLNSSHVAISYAVFCLK